MITEVQYDTIVSLLIHKITAAGYVIQESDVVFSLAELKIILKELVKHS